MNIFLELQQQLYKIELEAGNYSLFFQSLWDKVTFLKPDQIELLIYRLKSNDFFDGQEKS